MAIKYGYFNSKNGDRAYDANDVNFALKRLVSNGIYANPGNNLQAVAGNDMNIIVKAGGARIEWRWFEMDTDQILTIETSNITMDRKDRVVLRLDTVARDISLIVKKGTDSSNPVAPELTRTSEIYELSLAVIDIPKQATVITQAMIHDTRLDKSVCGIIGNLIQDVDTTYIYDQYTAAADEDRKNNQADFDAWFETVRDGLASALPVRQLLSHHITTTVGETEIPINIDQYNMALDILDVYVNGMKLVKDIDFTINDNEKITLSKPLDIMGTSIEFEVFKSVGQTMILRGNIDPEPALGQDGDIYINASNLNWKFFYKENGIWIDQGNIIGIDGNNKILVGNELDTAESKTLFIQTITPAQAIAETRGIAVNEYDVRIPMNQVRISDETNSQGLDEYINEKLLKTPNEYILNELGAIRLPESTIDPKTLIYEGNYVCGGCLPGTSPIDGVGCHITIRTLTKDDRTVIIDYRHNGTSWRNDLVSGVWTGWKLIAGEVLLWSGSAKVGSTVNIAHDINMFTTLRILLGNSTYQVLCPAFIGSDYASATANVPSGSSIYSANVLLQKISEKQVSVYNSVYLLNIGGSGHETIKTDEPVLAIYGRL